MNNRYSLIIILIILLLFLSGCWSRVELDKQGIVSGIGIDKAKEEGKLKLTVEILKPQEIGGGASGGKGGGKEKVSWMVSSTGHTIFEAIKNFNMESSRKLFLGHNRIIIVSEEVAREGIYPILDYYIRNRQGRSRTWILISKGKASNILQAEPELEKIPARGIEELLSAATHTSKTVGVDIHHILLKIASRVTSPVASRIEVIRQKKKIKDGSPGKVRLTGTAVFKGDKLTGWLNGPETRGFLWVTGKIQNGIVVVKSPIENKSVSLEIIRANSKIKPEIKDGEIIINIQIEEEGDIGDQAGKGDLTKQEIIKSLERRKATVIRNEIKKCLQKVQKEYKTDIFGFGKAIKQKFPDNWKSIKGNWDEIYPQIKVRIMVKSKIRRSGVIMQPIKLE